MCDFDEEMDLFSECFVENVYIYRNLNELHVEYVFFFNIKTV